MIQYDPYMEEVKQDPNAVYKQLRQECPVYYIERFNAWALALFEDIWTASMDREHYSTMNGTSDITFLEGKPANHESLAHLDPPRHGDLRRKVFPYFGPGATRALEPRIREWTIDCLERHADSGRIDAVGELAQQIAVRVSCHIGGFPVEDADYLVDVVMRFFKRDEHSDGVSEDGAAAQREAWDYLERLVTERKNSGKRGDDAMSALLDDDGTWGDETVRRTAEHLTLFLVGATETFPKTFATGLLRLAQHPDQRRELVQNPDKIPTALHEIFRYDMPTQWLGRTAIKDHEIRGNKIRAGQPILFLYPSGNRDEREFEDPDVFDITRNPTRHLSFGQGLHRCLGSFIAGMEGKVLFEEVLARFPEYEVLLDEAIKPATEFVQGYSHFPIAFK
jgi:cytochrome P450